MNDFERRVLMNQRELLFSAMTNESDPQQKERLRDCEDETRKLIYPIVPPTLAERTHDALSEENEVKN